MKQKRYSGGIKLSEEDDLVKEITDKNYKELIKDDDFIVLELWATWCAPCMYMEPILESLAKEFEVRVLFGKVNVEKSKNICSEFDIQCLPSVLFVKKGEMAEKVVGKMEEDEFRKKLKQNFDIE
ncbi:MAG: thioredoxin family protein [Thermoplasmata archaeon]